MTVVRITKGCAGTEVHAAARFGKAAMFQARTALTELSFASVPWKAHGSSRILNWSENPANSG
jgi:hypothetical protein